MVDTSVRIFLSCYYTYIFSANQQMQETLRSTGALYMKETDLNRFTKAHADGKLVKPEDVGHVIAALSVEAPKSLSGQFVSWDSAECKDFRRVSEVKSI